MQATKFSRLQVSQEYQKEKEGKNETPRKHVEDLDPARVELFERTTQTPEELKGHSKSMAIT